MSGAESSVRIPGLGFQVPDGWHVANAVTFTSERGGAASVTERETALSPADDLALRLAAASRTLPEYALERTRDVAIGAGRGVEATFTWTSPGGPATERIVVFATGEAHVTAFAFCFIGPREEHASAQSLFAWIGGSVA